MAHPSTWTIRHRVPRLGAGSAELPALVAMALFAALLGWAVARSDGFGADPGSAALMCAGGLACVAVLMAGPLACLLALTALTAAGLLPELGQVGGVNVTLADPFYAGVVGWWVADSTRASVPGSSPKPPRVAFGQGAAILFLAYAGLTLLRVAIFEPEALSDSLVSWLRLVQTASLAWFAASVLKSARDLKLVLGAIACGGVVAIAVALGEGGGLLTERFSGSLSTPNALGFVSGLLVLIAAFGRLTPEVRYRIALGAIGLLGLLLAKSVASLVATGFALALGASLASTAQAAVSQRLTRTALALTLAGIAVFGVVQFLRPEVRPGSAEFKHSSAYQRIVVGAAGVEIFQRNPVVGVGWRVSNSPGVIGDREISLDLRRRFPDASPIFYPDVNPRSVHNTYIQILADLGVIGFVLLIALIVSVSRHVSALVRRLDRDHELWPAVSVMSLGLILALVWLNDNPLYGGQPETVIPALFLGGLAAASRITAGARRSMPGRDPTS